MKLFFHITLFLILYAPLWKQCTEKRLFTHPQPAMYMYLYTTQQNRCLRVNASHLS
jgi:hypothetical protein